jgi:uncharacterized protein (DUF58 family)
MSTRVVLERFPVGTAGTIESQAQPLKRQRVFIFPTIQGWVYCMMLVVMLLGAINYNNSMAFMLCFLLASLGLVCMLHTYRNLTGLIITSTKPKPVFAGQQAFFPIQIDNRLGIERFSIKLQQYTKTKKLFRKSEQGTLNTIGVKASKQSTCYFSVQSKQRGILKAGRLKISTDFPLGIFTAWSYFEPEHDCLVYPAAHGQKDLPLHTLTEDDSDYGSESGVDDFSGFRKYRPGDPINSIAWKAFAREQGLLVKQFTGKGSQTLIFNWESVSHIKDIESRLSQLCYWVLLAEQTSIHYGLEIPGIKVNPDHGSLHQAYCLEALARYGTTDG